MFIKEIYEKDIGLPETQWVDVSALRTRIAVRWVIVDKNNNIAVLHLKKYWSYNLPWWWVEGDALDDAFVREIREEIGASITNIAALWITREHRYANNLINQSVVFSATVQWDLQPVSLEDEEIEEWHEVVRMPIEELKALLRKQLLDLADNQALFVVHRDLYILEQFTQSFSSTTSKTKELEEIAKKAQYDYIMLKSEFDSYVRRMEADTKESKVNQLVELSKKLLPIVDQLGQSVSHIPADLEGNTWADWVKLTYDNAIKTLAWVWIAHIPTVWHEPDMELHEPLSVEQTDDESMKWKIVREFQPGYVYEKDGIKKVITAAKVIVGQ
jgi:8-oxo-dGTP diphosphatase